MRHKDPSLRLTEEQILPKREGVRPAAVQAAPPSSQRDNGSISSMLLLGKLKSVAQEVMVNIDTDGDADVEDFISVTEECLRKLREAKQEKRATETNRRSADSVRPANLASPLACEVAADNSGETPLTPSASAQRAAKSYMAALMKQKKVSPKRAPFKPEVTRDDVEAARHASALRSEERQRQAEERRMDHLLEIKSRSEAADARGMRVKARREEAVQRQRLESKDRMDNVLRRAEENRKHTVERVQRVHSRVEEVRLANELRHQTKALLLDKKMSDVEQNQEARREARQRQAQEKRDAMNAAAERRRNLSEERAEKQQQRELQRQENLRRVEEQKKLDLEIKQHKAEEWEKKVHRHQEDAHAEAEALSRKQEEKFQQSAHVLEEQRQKRREKLEKQDQKLKEAKSRRDRECDSKSTSVVFLPTLTPQEEEQMSLKLAKLVASSSRQGKIFFDQYQRESLSSTKDLNRSKLRSLFSRLAASVAVPSIPQCKPILHETVSLCLTEVDHEYLRYFNTFETIVKVISEGRKARDFPICKMATDFLKALFTDEKEGKNHACYFVKSGDVVPLVLAIREELKTLRYTNNASLLMCMLSTVGVCLECLCNDTHPKYSSVRDQLLNDLEVTGLDRACQAMIKMCSTEKDFELAYCALSVIHTELSVLVKRKLDVKLSWFQHTAAALFSLLQNILTPDGVAITSDCPTLSCQRVTVLFCVFRCLNMMARWQVSAFQELLHDTSSNAVATKEDPAMQTQNDSRAVLITRMELFHALNGFFSYVQEHNEDLEVLPSCAEPPSGSEGTPSFIDAAKFGITLLDFPPLCTRDTENEDCKPGGKLYPLRSTLHECLLLVGYLCFDDMALQEMLSWGKGKTLLGSMLSVLPAPYCSNARHILFPTILSAVMDNPRNLEIVSKEIELVQLHGFLSEEFGLLSKKAKTYALEHNAQLKSYRIAMDPHHAMRESFLQMKGQSWAEMSDDSTFLNPTAPPASLDASNTTPTIEKEKLCKSFRAPGAASYQNQYRIEKRLPITYWPSSLEQLENHKK